MTFKSFHSIVHNSKVNYRSIHLKDHSIIPNGEYGLVQVYCDDIKCDCRRVILMVYCKDMLCAKIGFGWQEYEFYRKWARGSMSKKEIINYMGPCLHNGESEKHYSKDLLEFIKNTVFDHAYKTRLIQNYKHFRHMITIKN